VNATKIDFLIYHWGIINDKELVRSLEIKNLMEPTNWRISHEWCWFCSKSPSCWI